MNDRLFSVVMPAYNSEEYVGRAVESVLEQSCPDWELLAVDDCSCDRTREILRGYAAGDARIRVFEREINGGPAKARNLAIEQASGRFIAFLDSDDFWYEKKLEKQLLLFEETGAPLVYSAYERMDEKRPHKRRMIHVPSSIDYGGLLNATVIATLTAVYDTARVGKVMMPDIAKRQDYGLWLKILKRGGRACGLAEPLACLRKRSGSLSSNKVSAIWYTWRVYREIEKFSFGRSAYHFCNYAVRALVKNI